MRPEEPVRTVHVVASRSRIATVRDVAIIVVCAAILIATLADLFLPVPEQSPPPAAGAAASISL